MVTLLLQETYKLLDTTHRTSKIVTKILYIEKNEMKNRRSSTRRPLLIEKEQRNRGSGISDELDNKKIEISEGKTRHIEEIQVQKKSIR